MKLSIGLLLFVLLLIGANFSISPQAKVVAVPIPTTIPTPTPVVLDAHEIFSLVNDYRVSQGLNSLSWNETICIFANIRLQQIHIDYSHTGFYPENRKFYQSTYAGENLADGYSTNQETVTAWIASPEHLANIIDPQYTQTCVATDTIGKETYVVQEFASDF